MTKISDPLPVSDALERLLAVFLPAPVEGVQFQHTLGRVLAQEIRSPIDLPPFDNSAMDGFAVRAVDVAAASRTVPQTLQVFADIPAGYSPSNEVGAGQAARIMTGAAMPLGADAVVPVEETDYAARGPGLALPERVAIYGPAVPGRNVRPRGQDARSGEVLLSPGRRLRPQDVGLLAMMGLPQASVFTRPRVAVISSGDELLPVGEPLRPGSIYNSNGAMLSALVQSAGCEAIDLGVAPDQAEAVQARLDQAAAQKVHLIVSSAGVSVAAFDYVRQVVQANGRLDFWRVNMRPGKPLAFGAYRGVPLVGLPGNPVSAMVGFEVFVRPALARLAGLAEDCHHILRVKLLEAVETDGRQTYLRAQVFQQDGQWVARLAGHQGSGNLRGFSQANALLIVPSAVKSPPIGADCDAWLLDPWTMC